MMPWSAFLLISPVDRGAYLLVRRNPKVLRANHPVRLIVVVERHGQRAYPTLSLAATMTAPRRVSAKHRTTRSNGTVVHKLRIEVDANDWWTGFVGDVRVAEFEYRCDDAGRVWLANASTRTDWQRQGIGQRMIAAAVDYYGAVWASTAGAMEESVDDTRHLSEAGAALVTSCVRAGIMQPSWVRNPYCDLFDENRRPDE